MPGLWPAGTATCALFTPEASCNWIVVMLPGIAPGGTVTVTSCMCGGGGGGGGGGA
jgi:hypothetical protein